MAKTQSLQTFQLACEELGAFLESHGFRYRKSKRDSRRQGCLFEHIVTFRTSRSLNSLPGHIHFDVTALAWSERLADSRQQAGISLPLNEAVLFDATIRNIFSPAPPYIRYDIGDPWRRDDILKGIAEVLGRDVLRFFDLVEAPDALRAALDTGPIPCLSAEAIRDYFQCFKGG